MAGKHLLAAAFGAAPSSSSAGLSSAGLGQKGYGKDSTSQNLSLQYFEGKHPGISLKVQEQIDSSRLNPSQPQMLQSPPAVTLAPHWGSKMGSSV